MAAIKSRTLVHEPALLATFKQFAEQLADLLPCVFKRSSTAGGDRIESPDLLSIPSLAGAEITLGFKAMQHGIEGAGAYFVTVMPQFLDHPKTVKRLVRRMM